MATTTNESPKDATKKSNQVTIALSRNNQTGKDIQSVIPRERFDNNFRYLLMLTRKFE